MGQQAILILLTIMVMMIQGSLVSFLNHTFKVLDNLLRAPFPYGVNIIAAPNTQPIHQRPLLRVPFQHPSFENRPSLPELSRRAETPSRYKASIHATSFHVAPQAARTQRHPVAVQAGTPKDILAPQTHTPRSIMLRKRFPLRDSITL